MSNLCEKCGNDRRFYSDKTLTGGRMWCFWCVKTEAVKLYKERAVCPYCSGLSIHHKDRCQLIMLLEHTGGIKEI